jgi:hypothetical protein
VHRPGRFPSLLPCCVRAAPDWHLPSTCGYVLQGQNAGGTRELQWDASGTSQHTARWETTDGVRTPVMVCPKNLMGFLSKRKVIQEKAWVSRTTSVLQTIRPVLACDDFAGGVLPRVALVTPVPRTCWHYSSSLVHLLQPSLN